MATKAKAEEVEKTTEQKTKVTNVNIMPNWENTNNWLMVCKNIVGQRFRTPSASSLIKKVDNTKSNAEKFALIAKFTDEQIDFLKKRMDSLKSISEVAHYEEELCKKKEGA